MATLTSLLLTFALLFTEGAVASSAGTNTLVRRRNNYTVHSPETLAYLENFNYNVGLYLWLGLIGIIGLVTIANWAQRFQGRLRRRELGFRDTTKKLPRVKSLGPVEHHTSLRFFWPWLSAFYRKYSIKHSAIAEFFFLGDLAQLALLSVYLLLNFLLIFLGAKGDVDWYAHHAARLTYANIPLVIGLAGKNNVISKFTGFAYESLNVLHRWSARFIIISSAIHIGGRAWVNVPDVGPNRPGSRYIAWGWGAFALFLYMVFAASRPIRNRAYQFFLVHHLCLWWLIVACLVIHRPQEQGWIWAGFALHGLDRVARGCRIAYYQVFKTVEDKDDHPTGYVTVLSEDTIRVSIRTRQNWIPGQHVYLHCPEQSIGGHPFTVSNISRPLDQPDNDRPVESTQELLIRVREGLTKEIYKVGNSSQDEEKLAGPGEHLAPVPIKAWTEGPYGHEQYLGEDYDTLVLVAGGSGVSYALSNAMDVVRRARAMHDGKAHKSLGITTNRLSFVWTVKKPEQVYWIANHLQELCLAAPPGFLFITIYITGKRTAGEPAVLEGFVTRDRRDPVPGAEESATSDGDSQETVGKKVDHGASLELKSGRPDFRETVAKEVEATPYSHWIAIGSCGPTPMNDSLADAVSEAVKPMQVLRGEVRRNIYLTIEEFGW